MLLKYVARWPGKKEIRTHMRNTNHSISALQGHVFGNHEGNFSSSFHQLSQNDKCKSPLPYKSSSMCIENLQTSFKITIQCSSSTLTAVHFLGPSDADAGKLICSPRCTIPVQGGSETELQEQRAQGRSRLSEAVCITACYQKCLLSHPEIIYISFSLSLFSLKFLKIFLY